MSSQIVSMEIRKVGRIAESCFRTHHEKGTLGRTDWQPQKDERPIRGRKDYGEQRLRMDK